MEPVTNKYRGKENKSKKIIKRHDPRRPSPHHHTHLNTHRHLHWDINSKNTNVHVGLHWIAWSMARVSRFRNTSSYIEQTLRGTCSFIPNIIQGRRFCSLEFRGCIALKSNPTMILPNFALSRELLSRHHPSFRTWLWLRSMQQMLKLLYFGSLMHPFI